MYEDFVGALAKGENLDTVYRRIRERIYSWEDYQLKQAAQDFEEAKLIEKGLTEQKESKAYQMAAAFLEDAQDAEKHKSEAQKRREKMRQEVEEAYIKQQQERLEMERKATDAARQTVIEQEYLRKEILKERGRIRCEEGKTPNR